MPYNPGNIPLSANFNVAIAKPLDPKYSVEFLVDLSTIPFPYAGLITYVQQDQNSYVLQNDLITWEIIGSGGSGGSATLTQNIQATVNGLGIEIGDSFALGTTFTEFTKALIAPTILPTIMSPKNINLSGVTAETLEVGTPYSRQINSSFSRGLIESKDGSPNIFLVGAATNANYIGIGISTSGLINTNIILGNNQWSVDITHGQGSGNYYDSEGNTSNILDPQRSAGNITKSTPIVTGRFKKWISVGSVGSSPSTSSGVRALNNESFVVPGTFDIIIPANTREIVFFVPNIFSLSNVLFVESSNADVTGTFTSTSILVDDAGNDPVNYKKYITTVGGIGYPTQATYRVTIN